MDGVRRRCSVVKPQTKQISCGVNNSVNHSSDTLL
jgi:hypothetical protein